jgi:ESCRT-II complex subunit VPS22
MRRGVGVGALKQAEDRNSKMAGQGAKLDEEHVKKMTENVGVFRQQLEAFALKHKKDINKDPVLRKRFHEMCSSIGVDPLASQKGFWSELLGVGEFYYELGVQIIDVCLGTRHKNGGLMEVNALRDRVNALRPKTAQPVSLDDIERSIGKLKVLGSSYGLRKMGAPPNELVVVQSVPLELNHDHTTALQLARDKAGKLAAADLVGDLGWDVTRALETLEHLEGQGMAWIDDGDKKHRWWYFPSLWM